MSETTDTARATERMLNLLALLMWSTRPLTQSEIVEKMSDQYTGNAEGRRTLFERDKKALRQLGVPIRSITLSGTGKAGVGAYHIESKSEGYGNLYALFTDEEIEKLQMAAAMVQLDQPWGKHALARLGGNLPEADLPAGAHVPVTTDSLATLWSALRARHPVSFDYRGRSRTVHPYGLLSRNGFWYLAGLDVARDETRAFRVDRLESEVVVDGASHFERPADFKVSEAIAADSKNFGDSDETCLVRVDALLAPTVVAELGESAVSERHEDGSVDVTVACGNRFGFRSWLFAMVDRAEVLGPPAIRDEVMGWLAELAGTQGGN